MRNSAVKRLPFAACLLFAASATAEPVPQALPYDASRATQRLSIGERHTLLSRLAWEQPQYTVMVSCGVDRQSGQVQACDKDVPADQTPLLRNTAQSFARGLMFDLTGIDRADPTPLQVQIPVTLAQADLRPTDFSGDVLRQTDMPVMARPSDAERELAYPRFALREGIGASITALCQVQDDGSLVCKPAQVQQTDGQFQHAADFTRAAVRLLSRYRVAPALADGTPSAGRVAAFAIQFILGE